MKDNVQLTHKEHRQSNIKFPLSIIASDITDPLNVGSLFRLCDALAVSCLYLCGETPAPPDTKINKTSRSTEKHVAYESVAEAEALVRKLKKSGAYIISLEISSSSMAINSPEFAKAINTRKPVCLILGSENSGVNQALLQLSDITLHIPMYGHNSSMNVISACSIACYEITRNMKI